MNTITNIIEGVLYAPEARSAGSGEPVYRLTPGQAIKVWEPGSEVRHRVSFTRTVLETAVSDAHDTFVDILGGSKMIDIKTVEHQQTLTSPSVACVTRIGDIKPSWWNARRPTRSGQQAGQWRPLTGRDTAVARQSCNLLKSVSDFEVVMPTLGFATVKSLNQLSRRSYDPAGSTEFWFTPATPATAGIPAAWPSAVTAAYEGVLNYLMEAGLPLAVGWCGGENVTPILRRIPYEETITQVSAQWFAEFAATLGSGLDIPPVISSDWARRQNGETENMSDLESFGAHPDGRAAIQLLEEQVMNAFADRRSAWVSPTWAIEGSVFPDYQGLVTKEFKRADALLKVTKELFPRAAAPV